MPPGSLTRTGQAVVCSSRVGGHRPLFRARSVRAGAMPTSATSKVSCARPSRAVRFRSDLDLSGQIDVKASLTRLFRDVSDISDGAGVGRRHLALAAFRKVAGVVAILRGEKGIGVCRHMNALVSSQAALRTSDGIVGVPRRAAPRRYRRVDRRVDAVLREARDQRRERRRIGLRGRRIGDVRLALVPDDVGDPVIESTGRAAWPSASRSGRRFFAIATIGVPPMPDEAMMTVP